MSQPATAVVTILAVAVGAIVLLAGIDALVPGAVAIGTGVLLTATVTAANRRTPGGRAIASFCAVAAAAGVVLAVGLAVRANPLVIDPWTRAAVVFAIVLAAFGASATLSGAIGAGAVSNTIPIVVVTSVPVLGYAVVFSPILGPLWSDDPAGSGAVGSPVLPALPPIEAWLLAPGSVALALFTLGAIVAFVGGSIVFVLPRLPIPELFPGDRRETVAERIERLVGLVRISLGYGAVLAFLLLVVGTAILGRGGPPELVAIVRGIESIVTPIAFEPTLRVVLLSAAGLLWGLWLLSRLPFVYRLRYTFLVGWSPALLGGTIAALAAWVVYPIVYAREIRPVLETIAVDGQFLFVPLLGVTATPAEIDAVVAPPNGHVLAGLLVLALLGVLLSLLVGLSFVGLVRLLRDRAAPGTVAAAALVGGAIFAAIDGASTLSVVVPVACAVLAWDAAVYGVSITEELGRSADVRGPTVVHAVATAAVGAIAVGLAIGIDAALVGRLSVWEGGTVALAIAIAIVVSFAALKRWGKRLGG